MCVCACFVAAAISAPCAAVCRLLQLAASCFACHAVDYASVVDFLVRVWLHSRAPSPPVAWSSCGGLPGHYQCVYARVVAVAVLVPWMSIWRHRPACVPAEATSACVCACNYVTLSQYIYIVLSVIHVTQPPHEFEGILCF